jgi:broad specificity phosphatase PhoE
MGRYFEPRPGTAYLKLIPEGESLTETCQRATNGLRRLHEEHNDAGRIGIVTYGEVVRLLLLALLQAPLEKMFQLRGMNAAVTIFEFDGMRATGSVISLLPLGRVLGQAGSTPAQIPPSGGRRGRSPRHAARHSGPGRHDSGDGAGVVAG